MSSFRVQGHIYSKPLTANVLAKTCQWSNSLKLQVKMLSLLLLNMCFWVFSARASFDYIHTGAYSLSKRCNEIVCFNEHLIHSTVYFTICVPCPCIFHCCICHHRAWKPTESQYTQWASPPPSDGWHISSALLLPGQHSQWSWCPYHRPLVPPDQVESGH